MTELRVLFVQHVGLVGGSSRSLLEMLKGMHGLPVRPSVVCPPGTLSNTLREMGIPVVNCLGLSQFDDTRYSYYRRLRWVVLIREIALIFPTITALLRARWRIGAVDVVHINEYTLPLATWVARAIFRRSVIVVHSRCLQRGNEGARGRFLGRFYSRNADLVIAIDANVLSTLPPDLPTEIIHNGLHFSAETSIKAGAARHPDRPFTVAMVGMLSRSKGAREFLDAACICKNRGLPIRFVFFGAGARPARRGVDWVLSLLGLREDQVDEARQFVLSNGLGDSVRFEPFVADLERIYSNIDVVCFPSRLDAPGRPIFEAGFFGVPSIAAISSPKPDTFRPGESGIVIPAGDPMKLAEAIIRLYSFPDELVRMGQAARELAVANFDAERNAGKVYSAYLRLMRSRRQGARYDH